jgi:hypothetical protein
MDLKHTRRVVLVAVVWLGSLIIPGEARSQNSEHSPGTAFATSLLATAVPVGVGFAHNDNLYKVSLVSAGILFGPAAGYWTGGAASRGWKGVAFRGLVVGATAATVYAICNIDECNIFDDGQDATTTALVVTLLGGALIVGSSIIDIIEAPAHVRAANEARRGITLSLSPVIIPTDGGTIGLSGRVRF